MKAQKGLLKSIALIVENAVTAGAMKKNLLRVVTTLMAILLASASAWAGDHQICYQLPPLNGFQTIAARFLCRTDGANPAGCQITSVQADPASPQVTSFATLSQTPASAEAEATFSGSGTYIGTIQFTDGTVRNCTVEVKAGWRLTPYQGSQLRTLIGFATDASGLVMTGVWQATSAPADMAIQSVVVPPDFIAVGGGAEGAEFPDGTLVTSSIHDTAGSWTAGAHSNSPWLRAPGFSKFDIPSLQISPVIAWGIGLKIQGIDIATLSQIVQFPLTQSTGYDSIPTVTLNGGPASYPQTTATPAGQAPTAAISGGVQAQQAQSPYGQYVTATQPLVSGQCYVNGACEQLVRGWVTASKDHANPSPWWVVAQMTTLPKVLTINGSTFHVETWVSQSTAAPVAHPNASVGLPGDFALTGVGAFVDWQTPPSPAGNMVWRLKPRSDLNGVEAASKDQWYSSPAAITAFAIGMKLVPGPVPLVCRRCF